MQWLLSFFSSNAHIKYLLAQLESASRSIDAVRTKIDQEHEAIEEYVSMRKQALKVRGEAADRLEGFLKGK